MLVKPLLAVLTLVTGVVLYGVVPAFLTGPPNGEVLRPFQADSSVPRGHSDLGQFAEAIDTIDGDPAGGGIYTVAALVGSPSVLLGLEHPERVVYFAPGVSRDYRAEEANALVDLEKRGGRLLIADDFGYANTLAQKFGIFYFGTDLWDLDDSLYPGTNMSHFDKNISLPRVFFKFAGANYSVELNSPTGITLIQNPEVATNVIAHCSEKCYADIDRSGTVNIGDKKGNITVIIQARLQENVTENGVATYKPTLGEAYFIADSSVFSNEMLGTPRDLPPSGWHGNRDFAIALIKTLLPEGGVVVIDDSRHLHSGGTQAIYSSFEAAAVATSRAELASLLVGGAALVLAIVVLRAKDRENWIHKFDLSTFHPRAVLPETGAAQLERLRNVARLKIQMTHSMSPEEFAAVPPDQLRTMIRDPMLIDLILNPGRAWAPEELRPVADHIRAWGK